MNVIDFELKTLGKRKQSEIDIETFKYNQEMNSLNGKYKTALHNIEEKYRRLALEANNDANI